MNMNSCTCCTPRELNQLQNTSILHFGKLLRLVGDEKRLHLLTILRDGGEHCVCEFEDHLDGVSQSLLSHHLADLRTAGLVVSEKKGLRVYYRLTDYGGRVMAVLQKINKELEYERMSLQR